MWKKFWKYWWQFSMMQLCLGNFCVLRRISATLWTTCQRKQLLAWLSAIHTFSSLYFVFEIGFLIHKGLQVTGSLLYFSDLNKWHSPSWGRTEGKCIWDLPYEYSFQDLKSKNTGLPNCSHYIIHQIYKLFI